MIYDYKKTFNIIFITNINRDFYQILKTKINIITNFFVTLIFNAFIIGFFTIIMNSKLNLFIKARIRIIDLFFNNNINYQNNNNVQQ